MEHKHLYVFRYRRNNKRWRRYVKYTASEDVDKLVIYHQNGKKVKFTIAKSNPKTFDRMWSRFLKYMHDNFKPTGEGVKNVETYITYGWFTKSDEKKEKKKPRRIVCYKGTRLLS